MYQCANVKANYIKMKRSTDFDSNERNYSNLAIIAILGVKIVSIETHKTKSEVEENTNFIVFFCFLFFFWGGVVCKAVKW